MVDTKPQSCLFTTQQPVTSQPRLQNFTPQLMMLTSYIIEELADYTDVSKYYITKSPECYTATYAALAYCTEAPTYYNTEARKFYTATYAAPSHYATKYYSA
ncbi:hypothetical protein DAPPUDRAFT_241171 [Daphnia pulex]|uniref:Uncharacterized protein n=1 Tax=Daphnia pulex TaxID=6669 RepID=E9GDL2_DAPPU|nr:hypothetical protein DAPPUDRAFT_241171 [Daphnia pulex]|eukprot:EFX82103.1 hypothetical protein DAPPUDRAFT_241171 [Daphnia pulex]